MTPSGPESSDADGAVRRVLEARDDYFVVDGRGTLPVCRARVRVRLPEPGSGAGAGPSSSPRDPGRRTSPRSTASPRKVRGSAAERLLTPPTRRRSWTGMTAVALTNSGAENGSRGLRVTSVHPGRSGRTRRRGAGRRAPRGRRPASLRRTRARRADCRRIAGHHDRPRRTPRRQRAAVAPGALRNAGAALRCRPESATGAWSSWRRISREGRSDATRQLEAGICWILLGDPGARPGPVPGRAGESGGGGRYRRGNGPLLPGARPGRARRTG